MQILMLTAAAQALRGRNLRRLNLTTLAKGRTATCLLRSDLADVPCPERSRWNSAYCPPELVITIRF